MNVLDELVHDVTAICEVPAPTGRERERGEFVLEMLREAGLSCETDAVGNVIAEAPGDASLPTVAVAAHLDTVFPDVEEIVVRREDGWLAAPGIGDNSAGVGALVCLARHLPKRGIGRVLLVATVGEEGNGDLRGVRRLIDDRGDGIDAFLAVEGAMGDKLVTGAVGAERLRVTVRGPGGHSWGRAGTPSALEGAARLVADLYDLPLATSPRTTLNVGTFRSGHSVNSIAPEAVFDVDLRSLGQEELTELRAAAVAAAAARFPDVGPLFVEVEGIGSRPAGRVPRDHPLLRHARAAREAVGLPPAEEVSSSTDANIPLSRGIPATCLGVGTGEDAHKLSERLRIEGLDRCFAALLETLGRIASDAGLKR